MQRFSDLATTDKRLVLHCVIGSHSCTPIPDEVHLHGLRHRFALILDPYSESAASYETTASVLSAIFAEIAREFASSRVVAIMSDGTEHGELSHVTNHILGDEELNLPAKIYFYHEKKLVCLEFTENWAAVGGPQPYSDSLTFSFYTPEDLTLRFIDACERGCAQVPAVLGEYYTGSAILPTPVSSRWTTIVRYIECICEQIRMCARKVADRFRL